SRNAVHKLTYSGASTGKSYGILTSASTNFNTVGSPANNTFSNNLVYDFTSNCTSSTWNTSGIHENGGYGDKFYFNTVSLNA
ncbi:hypothetical protein ABTL22_19940, partial [Acinetobacter baumannii]